MVGFELKVILLLKMFLRLGVQRRVVSCDKRKNFVSHFIVLL